MQLAIEDCRKAGIMADFLRTHGSEVVNMLYTQFNMEDAQEVWYEEGKEEGIKQGKEEGIKAIILNLLKRNMFVDDICAIAECSRELVDEVQKTGRL